MTRTVFFHPAFYLDLMGLEPDGLAGIARGLDERGLRPVLSRELLVRLLTGSEDAAAGRRVAEAVMLLRADSLVLEDHLSWGMLAVAGDDRRALAAELRRQGRIAERLNRAIAETGFTALGLGAGAAEAVVGLLLPLLRGVGVKVADGPEQPGPGLRALGMRATDARRMAELLLHADAIQDYQLTEEQLERLGSLGRQHPLIASGWSGRCFAAPPGDPAGALARLG